MGTASRPVFSSDQLCVGNDNAIMPEYNQDLPQKDIEKVPRTWIEQVTCRTETVVDFSLSLSQLSYRGLASGIF